MSNGVLQGGTGYTGTPTIVISDPPSGTTATASATTSGGVITKFTVTNAGSGYVSNPTVTISGGNGSGALAEARVKHLTNDNVALPFGGFPGASFG